MEQTISKEKDSIQKTLSLEPNRKLNYILRIVIVLQTSTAALAKLKHRDKKNQA